MDANGDVRLSIADVTAFLRLSRPGARNAIRAATLDHLDAHLASLREDAVVRTVVIAAEPPAFCAGVDLDEAERLSAAPLPERRAFVERLQQLTRSLRSLPQVTIAAVDGVAVGLGAELAIACDVRFAGDEARFCFPELGRGLFPTNGVTALLPALIGSGRAHELLLGGEWIDADAADAMGLARRAAVSAEAAADAFADAVAQADGNAMRLAIRALRAGDGERVEAALRLEAASAVELTEMRA
jgi:2-(1,2-epoxy-1,2-dihydrophenyl)acetyl-CoA isomerase